MAGTVGCDVVARFEDNVATGPTPATWTAYTGGDTTWTVEVTDNVVYAGGHQRWQNNPGQPATTPATGAVSREGIAALNTVNGLPYSWNPTRARGVGVQDMLATSDGLYVGSDTELLGHTAGNTYHARIALPAARGRRQRCRSCRPTDPAASTLYRVAVGGLAADQAQLHRHHRRHGHQRRRHGPGWGTSTGAFMVNGVLYKANTDGSLSKMTFDGTTYGAGHARSTPPTPWSTRPTGTPTSRRSPACSTRAATSTTRSRAPTRSTVAPSRSRAASSASSGSPPRRPASTTPTCAARSSPAASSTTPPPPATCGR